MVLGPQRNRSQRLLRVIYMLCLREFSSFLAAAIHKADSQVPYQLIAGEIRILVEAVVALSFELVSVGQLDVVQEVLVHLHALQLLKRGRVEVVQVVVCVTRALAGEEQSVVADLAVEGFGLGYPAQVRVWLGFLCDMMGTVWSISAMTCVMTPLFALTSLMKMVEAYFNPTILRGAMPKNPF